MFLIDVLEVCFSEQEMSFLISEFLGPNASSVEENTSKKISKISL